MPKTAAKSTAHISGPTLGWSDDPASNELISTDATAFLIGYCLDQQITVEQAFMGPLRIKQRVGTIDATALAKMDTGKLETAFRERPAVHRFPSSMAQRVQKLCAVIAEEYDGDPRLLWTEAKDGADLYKRLRGLPGIGEMKARAIVAMVGKYWRTDLPKWRAEAPKWPTLADVQTIEQRIAYQTKKRAHKAELRAQAQS